MTQPKDRAGITLEAFTHAYHPLHMLQALNLSRLVAQEQDWLKKTNPGTLKRYYHPIRDGIRNIARIAASSEVDAFVIRKSSAAVGIGTIIAKQSVIHPDKGEIVGDDLDYWLKLGLDDETHAAVAGKLIEESQELHRSRNGQLVCDGPPERGGRPVMSYPVHSMLAVVDINHPSPARGFATHLQAVGEPTLLAPGMHPDTYDIAKDGHTVQVYEAGNEEVRRYRAATS